ncbi:MAG: hypothetical protein NDJ94_23995 [Vicinamibacteria bacterium]|nr:hypothetical protein [Vicinamibacteria bacterium]
MSGRRPFLRALTVASALAACAGLASAQDVLKIYRCQHRPTWELLPLAESTLGAAGRVAEDGGTASLILSGEASAVARTLAILAAVDVPPKTLDLHYEIVDEADLDAAGVRLEWRAGPGGFQVAVAAGARSVRSRGSSQGRVRVQEGGEGRIAAGELIYVPSGPWGGVTPVAAEQALVARPQVMGDGKVRLDLVLTDAERTGRGPRGAGVGYTEAASQLVLAPGETAVVGAIESQTSGRELGTGGAAGQRGKTRKLLLIRAEIVP